MKRDLSSLISKILTFAGSICAMILYINGKVIDGIFILLLIVVGELQEMNNKLKG